MFELASLIVIAAAAAAAAAASRRQLSWLKLPSGIFAGRADIVWI